MTFEWANKDSRDFLSKGYLQDGEDIETRVSFMADKFYDELLRMGMTREKASGISKSFFEYAGRGFYSFASPVLANYGRDQGLPVSCNNVVIDDDMGEILQKVAEIGMQTKHGAGTSAYLGRLRPRGSPIRGTSSTADGAVHFSSLIESNVETVRQGGVRRGACAVYYEIDSPDIYEVLRIQEDGFYIKHLSFGLCVGDDWLKSMLEGDPEKRKIWAAVISKRRETGYPYLFFKDNVNKAAPKHYKDAGLTILSSNLCTEIMQPSDTDISFVCVLGSMNLALFDEWVTTNAVEVYTYFLDCVVEEYVRKTTGIKFMESVNKAASEHRAIGVGTLGLHTLYQSRGLPFESVEARELNIEVHKVIDERTKSASREMAKLFGEPELLKGTGLRNATLMAVAPTTSSSFVLGQVSPSIEPLNSNYFTKDLAKGKYTFRNPELKKLLEEKYAAGKAEPERTVWLNSVWRSILIKDGSVQHLDFLSEDEKAVFKTFGEISQLELVIQASDRQQFIDQGQSLNLMIHPSTPAKDIHELLITAWSLGLKSLYYQRSTSPAQQLARDLVSCTACEA